MRFVGDRKPNARSLLGFIRAHPFFRQSVSTCGYCKSVSKPLRANPSSFDFNRHHVRLYTLAARKRGLFKSGVRTYDFRLKEIGFQHAVDDKATFDQFFLFDYICKPFSKQSADEMTEYHLFGHFNHVDLARPIEYDVGRNHRGPDMIHRSKVRSHHHHPSARQYSA